MEVLFGLLVWRTRLFISLCGLVGRNFASARAKHVLPLVYVYCRLSYSTNETRTEPEDKTQRAGKLVS